MKIGGIGSVERDAVAAATIIGVLAVVWWIMAQWWQGALLLLAALLVLWVGRERALAAPGVAAAESAGESPAPAREVGSRPARRRRRR